VAVPGFQDMMLPLLKLAGDDQEHTLSEGIGVAEEQTYTVKKVDLDYFGEEYVSC
jgi:restriction endonuclease Mrr